MANLLPADYQKRVRRSLAARVTIAGSLIALLAALAGVIALLPSYLSVRVAERASARDASAPTLASDADRAIISAAQSLTKNLSPLVSATTTPTDAIQAALALKPAGLSLDTITYTPGAAGGAGHLLLSGIAQDPSQIAAWQSVLSKDSHFSGVSVPVGALVGTENGRFSMTLTGPF